MKYLIWVANDFASVEEIVTGLKTQGIESELMLVQDGLFFADKGNKFSATLKELGVKVHAIRHHVEERGVSGRLVVDVNLVEYDDAIDIMMEQSDKIISL